ncbi:BRCT domain-containing protein [Rhodobacter capsulatus]|uniref:BRCT domain-containing protein n=1 Tax=Rhodobacter capsulatus TaxID=1061 RepID=UPI0003D36CEC|nr:BRCT domain-containing protein [Rhodobacter capsulatus]ETD87527.1 hypothetical protein U716_01310 [Rhodobacter capsulatus B6]
MDHNGYALGRIHRVANDRKFFCHFTGFLEGVAASGMIERGEVAPLLAECREFVSRIADDDAHEILEDFEAELLEHDTITLMVDVRARQIDPECPKSSLNRFLGYCRGIVCDNVITTSEAQGILQMIADAPQLLDAIGVKEIHNTCLDAVQDEIVTPDESLTVCDAIGRVVGDSYGDTGLSDVFGVANYDECKLARFPEDLDGAQVVLTGTFQTVPRSHFEDELADLGAVIAKSVSGKTDYLIVGGTASRDWIEVNRGTKLRKAMELCLVGKGPRFVSEWQLLSLMGK